MLYRENLPVIICVSKITFHGDVPQSALEWGLAWKVILIKARQQALCRVCVNVPRLGSPKDFIEIIHYSWYICTDIDC